MNPLNQLILEGTVCKAPLAEQVGNGQAVVTVTVAVKRSYTNLSGEGVDEVSYFDAVGYGMLAERCLTLTVGKPVRIVGRLKQERWKDSAGKSRSKVVVVLEHLDVLKG